MTEEQSPAPGLYLDSGEFVPAAELGASATVKDSLTDAQIRQIHFDWLTSTGGADSLIGFARAIIAATAAKKAAE